MKTFIVILLSLHSLVAIAQENGTTKTTTMNFPEKCLGIWKGTMYIYNNGILRDSVTIRFTAAKTKEIGTYTWKTEYLSDTRPMTKDYKLVVYDLKTGQYFLDEGNNVKLAAYNIGNKLYSMFKVNDTYLTSCSELVNNKIVFEVTSGNAINQNGAMIHYSYTNIQRVVMTKEK